MCSFAANREALPPAAVSPHLQTTQEFLAFMGSDRRHIKEGLLPDCSKVRSCAEMPAMRMTW